MTEISDMLKRLVTMGAKFEAVSQQVNRIEERQIEILQRLSTLEERTHTINESARSAAAAGVSELRAQLAERMTRLELLHDPSSRRDLPGGNND